MEDMLYRQGAFYILIVLCQYEKRTKREIPRTYDSHDVEIGNIKWLTVHITICIASLHLRTCPGWALTLYNTSPLYDDPIALRMLVR